MTLRLPVYLLPIVWLAQGVTVHAQEPLATPRTRPAPPQQGQDWEAPKTELPQRLVEAIDLLFKQAMPDPRGCEYRQIEVELTAAEKPLRVKCAGWVLPAQPDEAQRWVITWTGMLHPVAATTCRSRAVGQITPSLRRLLLTCVETPPERCPLARP